MIELPGGGRLYTEDEPMPTVEELIASMTPEQLAASAAVIERLHALQDTFEDDTGQTLYTSVLLPCPFCGAGADPGCPRPWVQTSDALPGGWEARVDSDSDDGFPAAYHRAVALRIAERTGAQLVFGGEP